MNRQNTLHFQKDFSAAEFERARVRVMQAMGDGVAVIASATEVPGFDPLRQSNDFYYLTGVESPHTYLTMDGGSGKCTLYLPPRDPKREGTDGPTLSDEDGDFVRSKTGIEEVRPIAELMKNISGLSGTLWMMHAPAEGARQCQDTLRHYHKAIANDPMDNRPSREMHLMGRIADLSPDAEFADLSPIVHRLRLIKSPAEVEVMRIAARLTVGATIEAMRATRLGVTEFQLAAVADYYFQINGAQGMGYRPIIATASNIFMMHYWRNNAALADGELVLFDFAPDYNYYTSDIGRMWPVNGKYSAVQRELYGFVLNYHQLLLEEIQPGRTKDQVLAAAAGRMAPVVEKTLWSKEIYKIAAMKLLESKRPLSHGVGMSVHEAMDWSDKPMEPGLVFAVDPELVVPQEQLYIRVEDTVLVTANGIENLTCECPREMDDVEKIVGQHGMLQCHPPVHVNPSR